MNLLKIAAAAALVACAPFAAQAVPMGGALNYSVVGSDVGGQAIFAGFDTSLGTLAGTSISYTVRFDVTGNLVRYGDPYYAQGTVTATASVFGPTGTLSEDTAALADLDRYFESWETWTYNQSNQSITSSIYDFDTWAYTNLSEVTVNYGVSIAQSDGNVYGDIFATGVNGDFTLTYYYDAPEAEEGAVPEPASWAMMIVGFGAIGGAMRRRPGAPLAA